MSAFKQIIILISKDREICFIMYNIFMYDVIIPANKTKISLDTKKKRYCFFDIICSLKHKMNLVVLKKNS